MDGIKTPLTAGITGSASSIDSRLSKASLQAESGELKKSKEAARQFEALLLHQMFNSMSANVPKDSLMGGGREDEFARDMYNQALAESISKGQGIGIKEVLERDLVNKNKGLAK